MEEEWFGSCYYNILYSHRNEEEAQKFIENLLQTIPMPPNAHIWDMACGSGRHAFLLAKKNLKVSATDSSRLCINEAKKIHSHPNINYLIHNYTEPIRQNTFDLVLNLFTSLGYTNVEDELDSIFHVAYHSLKTNGMFLIDFLNPDYVEKHFIPSQKITINNITFKIKRSILINPPAVQKNIEVITDNKNLFFKEWVRLYKTSDFLHYAENNNFKLTYQWGDYDLNRWGAESPRNILLFVKQ